MKSMTLTITPKSAFGTPPLGDTMFGQVCWCILRQNGTKYLGGLLEGYLKSCPFLVVSDAMPHGCIPRPSIPLRFFNELDDMDLKRKKKWKFVPQSVLSSPVSDWLRMALLELEAKNLVPEIWPQPHNSINRQSNTTGEDGFAPYSMSQIWYGSGVCLDVHLVFDEGRISQGQVKELFEAMGSSGFGRDASIGLGKFEVNEFVDTSFSDQKGATSYLTLAPVAPQGMAFKQEESWYQAFTRFGRHGEQAALSGQPFKNPVLMASAGAVLTPQTYVTLTYVGQGLGGGGLLSRTIEETVHQGYAPVIGVQISMAEKEKRL